MGPREYEDLLERCDVVIVSDVEARCFHLNPEFFDRAVYGKKVVAFPDRLKLLTQAVESGKGLIYLGGWLSFSGHLEKGGWRRCPIAQWLPFTCLVGDDLVESSEGFHIGEVVDTAHPILQGLPLRAAAGAACPRCWATTNSLPRDGTMKLLWRVAETGHPLLWACRSTARGAWSLTGLTPVPHWGMNFMLWKGYADFWRNLAAWCARGV